MSRSSMYSPMKRARIDVDEGAVDGHEEYENCSTHHDDSVRDEIDASDGVDNSEDPVWRDRNRPALADNHSSDLTFPQIGGALDATDCGVARIPPVWDEESERILEQSKEALDNRLKASAYSISNSSKPPLGRSLATAVAGGAVATDSEGVDSEDGISNGRRLHQSTSIRSDATEESEMILSSQLSEFSWPLQGKMPSSKSKPGIVDGANRDGAVDGNEAPIASKPAVDEGVDLVVRNAEELNCDPHEAIAVTADEIESDSGGDGDDDDDSKPTAAAGASLFSLVEAGVGRNGGMVHASRADHEGTTATQRDPSAPSFSAPTSNDAMADPYSYSAEDSQHSAASDMSGFAAITAAAESVDKMPFGHSLNDAGYSSGKQRSPYRPSDQNVPLMEHFDAAAAELDYENILAADAWSGSEGNMSKLHSGLGCENSQTLYHSHNASNGFMTGNGARVAGGGANSSTTNSANNRLVTCNCKKSKCLKMYCDCFRMLQYCKSQCNCKECSNLEHKEAERKKAIATITERNPEAFKPRVQELDPANNTKVHLTGCHCRKSSCLKKYCECFTGHVPCGDRCRCVDCKNAPSLYPGYSSNMQLSSRHAVYSGMGHSGSAADSTNNQTLPSLFAQVSSSEGIASDKSNALLPPALLSNGTAASTTATGSSGTGDSNGNGALPPQHPIIGASSYLEPEASAFLLSALSSPNCSIDPTARSSSVKREDRNHMYRDAPTVLSESSVATIDTEASSCNGSITGGHSGSSRLDSYVSLGVGGISFTDEANDGGSPVAHGPEGTAATPKKSRTSNNLCIKSPVCSLLDLAEVVVVATGGDDIMYNRGNNNSEDGAQSEEAGAQNSVHGSGSSSSSTSSSAGNNSSDRNGSNGMILNDDTTILGRNSADSAASSNVAHDIDHEANREQLNSSEEMPS